MAKEIIEGIGAYYQHYPRAPVIVTAQAKGKSNAMTAAWHIPLSHTPPLYGVAIASKRSTYQLIVESKEFGVNFLSFDMAEIAASVGGSKGVEIDKFQRFSIARDKPARTAVPILKAAYAAYECKLLDDRDYGDHRLLVGEIVATHQLREVFTPEEILDLDKVSPLLYMGHEVYATTSRDVRGLDREVYGKLYKEA